MKKLILFILPFIIASCGPSSPKDENINYQISKNTFDEIFALDSQWIITDKYHGDFSYRMSGPRQLQDGSYAQYDYTDFVSFEVDNKFVHFLSNQRVDNVGEEENIPNCDDCNYFLQYINNQTYCISGVDFSKGWFNVKTLRLFDYFENDVFGINTPDYILSFLAYATEITSFDDLVYVERGHYYTLKDNTNGIYYEPEVSADIKLYFENNKLTQCLMVSTSPLLNDEFYSITEISAVFDYNFAGINKTILPPLYISNGIVIDETIWNQSINNNLPIGFGNNYQISITSDKQAKNNDEEIIYSFMEYVVIDNTVIIYDEKTMSPNYFDLIAQQYKNDEIYLLRFNYSPQLVTHNPDYKTPLDFLLEGYNDFSSYQLDASDNSYVFNSENLSLKIYFVNNKVNRILKTVTDGTDITNFECLFTSFIPRIDASFFKN